MKESDYYPAGAWNDQSAPYNQPEPQEMDFDVNVHTTLQKDAKIRTNNYIPEFDEEDGRTYPNTDDTNWIDAYKEYNHTPLELIQLFKECLEYLQENNIKWASRKRYFIKGLIEECDGWNEEEFEVEY